MTHKQDTKATEVDEAQAAANRFADKASAAISAAAEKDEGKRISYPAIMRRLTGCVREYRAATVATPLLVLGEVACEMTIPFVTANLIDTIKVGATVQQILPTAGLLVLLAIVSLVFGASAGITCSHASCGFAKNLRHDRWSRA